MLLIPRTGLLIGPGKIIMERLHYFVTLFTKFELWWHSGDAYWGDRSPLGGMSLSLLEADQEEELSLWISVPAAMTLYILDEVTQRINPNGLTGWLGGVLVLDYNLD